MLVSSVSLVNDVTDLDKFRRQNRRTASTNKDTDYVYKFYSENMAKKFRTGDGYNGRIL